MASEEMSFENVDRRTTTTDNGYSNGSTISSSLRLRWAKNANNLREKKNLFKTAQIAPQNL